jgi:hypothetical protein
MQKKLVFLAPAFMALAALGDQPADWPRRPLGADERPAVRVAEATPRPNAVGAVSHLLLPTSANVSGQFGAYYKTKVSIFNAVNATYLIRAGLSDSTGEITHAYITIQPGETVTSSNFLADVFGYYGGGAIDLDSGNSSLRFVVNSQVYVDTVNGRYTTAVQFADDLGAITPSRPGYIVGISVNSSRRTNVGCASNSGNSQTISFQAFDSNNFAVGNPAVFVLPPYAWSQVSYSGSLTNGGIYVTASQNAVCYAVEVDNTSNDGTYQLATPF